MFPKMNGNGSKELIGIVKWNELTINSTGYAPKRWKISNTVETKHWIIWVRSEKSNQNQNYSDFMFVVVNKNM